MRLLITGFGCMIFKKKNKDITYTGLLYEPKENGQNTNLL